MIRSLFFWSLWLGFILYAFLLAPPDDPQTLPLIQDLATGNWDGINPLVVALFNVLGLLPVAYASFLLPDGHGQRIRAFPFALAAFAVGAFALLPYLALRQPNPTAPNPKSTLLKLLDTRWTGALVSLGIVTLLLYGTTQGNWSDFWQQWQTSRFVHVMSLDFVLTCLLVPALLGDDLVRRGIQNRRLFWAIALLPLLGLLVYLPLRPPSPGAALPTPATHPAQP